MANRLTDQELRTLVTNAMQGSRESVTGFLKYYTADMYYVSRLYLKDKETAKKAVQQALRKALPRLGESLKSPDITEWITGLVRQESLAALMPVHTSGAYSSYYDSSDEVPAREDVIAFTEEECRIRILKALDKITEPERAVMALRFFDHMQVDEIASLLSVSGDEVRSLLVSGKAGMRNAGIPIETLAALCERVKPESFTANEIVIDEPAAEAETPAAGRTETSSVQYRHARREESSRKPAAEPEPVIREDSEPVLAEPDEPEQPAVSPAAEVQPVIAEPEETPEPEVREIKKREEVREMPARKKKKSHVLLKSIIAILLGALAAVGLYAYLFMNKPKPAVSAKPAASAETEKTEETAEKPAENTSETKQETSQTSEPAEKPAETPAETPSEPENTDGVIGTAEVIVDELRIRSGSGTGFEEVDVAPYGAVYDVYEARGDSQYMWYRIGDDMWIADSEGSWITFTPKN